MAALLNSLSFAFKNSFLPECRVKYYYYIVKSSKWSSSVEYPCLEGEAKVTKVCEHCGLKCPVGCPFSELSETTSMSHRYAPQNQPVKIDHPYPTCVNF